MELVLKNNFAEIPPAADAVEHFLSGQGASPDVLYAVRLAIEELVTNTIKYGYEDHGVHEIHIDFCVVDGALVLEISDDGHPFNPLSVPKPELHFPATERPIGGLGLHLVRNMTDSLEYEFRDGRNIVTVRKLLVRKPSGRAPSS